MSRLLRILSAVFLLTLSGGGAFAGAYMCPAHMMYTRCKPDYYLDDCGNHRDGRILDVADLEMNNQCLPCPNGYQCDGERACPGTGTTAVIISYNLNGGTGTTPSDTICTTESTCVLNNGNTNSFRRAGYVLLGWATSASGTPSWTITATANDTVYAIWSACTGATFKPERVVATGGCTACPSIYDDNTSPAKTSVYQCQVRTTAGYYIANEHDSTETQCTGANYCPSELVDYGSKNAPYACPDDGEHPKTTPWPDNYYNPTMDYIALQTWRTGQQAITDCRVNYQFQNERGQLRVEDIRYNPETDEYDNIDGNSPYYMKLHPGYYGRQQVYDPSGCNANTASGKRMLYREAVPCPAGSYCPGTWPDFVPDCNNPDYQYTETNFIYTCPSTYASSAAQSTSINACYLNTTAGKYVATAGAGQVTCLAGGYCAGGTKVFYNGTGGRTACVIGSYSETGSSTGCIACQDGTTTSAAGSATCNATCANATDSQGDDAVKSWADATWNTNNTVTNLCVAVSCRGGAEGHYLDSGNCPRCDSLANGLYPRSANSGTTGGTEACFMYTDSIAGHYIATERADTATPCPLGQYFAGSDTAVIHYGQTSHCDTCPDNTYADHTGMTQCTPCLENYTTYGEKISASACRIQCQGGSYLATANATRCTDVGPSYWAPQAWVTQGSVGTRNRCPDGMTTIGYGAGADESGDCGRVLHIGDGKLYLRSGKKTELSLNVKIGDTTYYGNMSTEDNYMSDGITQRLKINIDGTEYSVYDDSGASYLGGDEPSVTLDPNVVPASISPSNYNSATGMAWSATFADGTVVSGNGACDATTASNGDISATGFSPSGSGTGCWCRIENPAEGARWVYATTVSQCSTKCGYMCANNMKGSSSKNITYRSNLYSTAGLL